MYRKYRIPVLPHHSQSSIQLNPYTTSNSSFAVLSQASMISKLESKKKHFIGVSKQYSEVLKSTSQIKQRLQKQLSETNKPSRLSVNIKNINNSLNNTLVIYNNNLETNHSYKHEINKFRMNKKKNNEIIDQLQKQMSYYRNILENNNRQIQILQSKKQQQMINIEELMQKDRENKQRHNQQLQELNEQYHKQQQQIINHHHDLINTTQITVDTHLILKNRLKNIIEKNKKVYAEANTYQSILVEMRSQFKQIMRRQKVYDVDGVANLFGSIYQQNQSLYNYINKLSYNITQYERQIKLLQKNIKQQKQINTNTKLSVQSAKKSDKIKQNRRNNITSNKSRVDDFNQNVLSKISSTLKSTLLYFCRQSGQQTHCLQHNYDLNQKSIQTYLSDLEKHINSLYELHRLRMSPRNKFTKLDIAQSHQSHIGSHYPHYPSHQQGNETVKYILSPYELTRFAQQYLDRRHQKPKTQHHL